jgi:TPR repeat protein
MEALQGLTMPPIEPALPAPLSPEDLLRAIFTQAFAGKPITLPPGGSVVELRAAMALDARIITAIFQDVRAQARPAPVYAAPLPEPTPGVRRGPERVVPIMLAGLLVMAGAAVWHFHRKPPSPAPAPAPPPLSTAQLYGQAAGDAASYQALAARAKAGDAQAAFDIATLQDSGLLRSETTVPKNDAQALIWYQAAASAGLPQAENNLAYAYHTGHGVAQNDAMATKYYGLAAQAGLANAQNSLGFLLQNGLGVPENDAQALGWYQKAAAQGFATAENNLGAAYQAGLGTPQNYPLAAQWFTRAAAQGEPNAENRLGYLYYYGLGVPQDNAQALHWFSAGAAQGLAAAQRNLGLLYIRGAGVPRDPVTAAKFLLLAQAGGDAEAGVAMGLINPPLTPAQLASAKAAAAAWKPIAN